MRVEGDDFRETSRKLVEARRFLLHVRHDFATRDAIDQGELDPDLENTCDLCWAEAFASIRAFRAVAGPGMSEREIDYAVWEWMHTEPDGTWAWKRRRRRNDNEEMA